MNAPYTGTLSHPLKGRLHMPIEGMTVEEIVQKAGSLHSRLGLIGRYYLSIYQAGQLITKHPIQ